MAHAADPGWKPAIPQAGRIVTGRSPEGSILVVLRAAAILLSAVAVAAGLFALVFGAGSQEPRIGSATARILISAAMGASVIGISMTGRGGPDTSSPGRLAVSVFEITIRRMLFAAALGPAGLAISWLAGDATYVVFGTGLAALLVAVASPTRRRLEQFQGDVDEAGSKLSVVASLQLPYR